MRPFLWIFLPVLLLAYNDTLAAPLVPPPGYFKAAAPDDKQTYTCPEIPKPFTSVLDFPSKYEGAGEAQDKINPEAQAVFIKNTQPIDAFEKGVSKLTDKYMYTGNPAVLSCVVSWLKTWSEVDAIDGNATSYNGMAVRKWTLAAISSNYLRLKFSASAPLKAYPEEGKHIEAWLGHLADKVVVEWNPENTKHKINNHYYWAAWSVMATGIVLDRKDLFDWSMKIYDIFASQVDKDGYLPYELARRSRAYSYHQFAIAPLSMMAAFAKANGIDAEAKGDHALTRVAKVLFTGMDNISIFEAKAGEKQNMQDTGNKYKWTWLEAYCSVAQCPDAIKQKRNTWRPLKHTRLGGDVTAVFQTP